MSFPAQPPFISDEGHNPPEIKHLFDMSEPGAWADALLFPHSITILDDAPCNLTEPDGTAQPLVTVPRREVADTSLHCRPPARVVLPPHSQPDSPEAFRNGH